MNGEPIIVGDRILHETWQAKIMLAAKGKVAAVVMSMLGHAYGSEAVLTLLQALYPGFVSIQAPFYCSAGRIAKNGEICAHLFNGFDITRNALVFKNESEMEGALRRLADEVKLDDADRIEMFKVVKKWIVCDWRFAPNSPELAERLAS